MDKVEKLKAIEEEVVNLVESPLYRYRIENGYFPVSGEGDHNAIIMFVGEAPGKNEAKTGRPFCGAAGKVLDQLLAHSNIERKSVFITNIVKDRPPENRDPNPEEIKIYGPLLKRQIDIIQPKIIATLGRYAMAYILEMFDIVPPESKVKKIKGKRPAIQIGDMHGKKIKTKAGYGDIEIAVLYHPCVAVYNPKKLPELKKEFEIIRSDDFSK